MKIKMTKHAQVVITAVYLLLFLSGILSLLLYSFRSGLPDWLNAHSVAYHCVLSGGFGGCVYCLRSVYLNACVKKNWDGKWIPWYLIRPFVSMACGGISFIFLKAGLLVLEAEQKQDRTDFAFYAFALIAGLNVDKFIAKIEKIAQSVWGIEESRTKREQDKLKVNDS